MGCPVVQFGRQGGKLRCQVGLSWNTSNWRTNLYSEDWVSENLTFRDNQVGAGAFICLTDTKFSCSIMYHEFEGRLVSLPGSELEYSMPVVAKTTWMTIRFSF